MAFIGSSTTPANFSKLQGGIQVTGDDITDGDSNTIFDQTNNQVPLSILEENSLTVTAGDGLSTGGSVTLGGSVSLDINPSDFAGTYISTSGDDLTVNLGTGIKEDSNDAGNIAFDTSLAYTFSSTLTLNAGATLGGDIDADSTASIINLPDPSDLKDAANKAYVDTTAQGLNIKDSVVAATAGTNIDLSTATDGSSIDGVTINDGDRVLLKDQSDATENGIYEAVTATDTSTWVRAGDFDEDTEVTGGEFAFVTEGDSNGSSSFTVTSDNPVLGTDPIVFDQFATAGEFVGADGINISGRDISVNTSDLVASSNAIDESTGDLEINTDSTLTLNGSQLSIDTGNSLTFSAEQTFNAGIDLDGDITDGTDTIYDSTNNEIPDSILGTITNSVLDNTDITINANNGISGGGTATLGDTDGSGVGVSIAPGDFIDTTQLSVNGSGNISIDDIFLANDGDTVSGSFTFGDFFDLKPITAPSSPASGEMRVFMDSSDNNLKAKADDGSVVTVVTT